MCQSDKFGVKSGSNTESVRPHPGASRIAIGFGGPWLAQGLANTAPMLLDARNAWRCVVDAGWIDGRAAGARPASRETSIRFRPGVPAHSGDHVLGRCHVLERGADQPFGGCINVHRLVQFGHAGLAFLWPGPNLGAFRRICYPWFPVPLCSAMLFIISVTLSWLSRNFSAHRRPGWSVSHKDRF